MTRKRPTFDTSVSALEVARAARNERQTLAEGSLAGERRIALARLALAGVLALVSEMPRMFGHAPAAAVSISSAGYLAAAIAISSILRSRDIKPARISSWAPTWTVIDFSFVTAIAAFGHPEDALALHPIACAILIAFTVARYNVWHVALAVALAIASYVSVHLLAEALDAHPATFAIAGYMTLGIVIGVTNHAVHSMLADLRRRDHLTRFLPQQVVDRVLQLGTEALAPVQREVTILFSDIRGFTAMSETLEPRLVLSLLDNYFGQMTQIVRGHDGVVGKFIGDGMLAFWGAPDRVDDHAARAMRAVRDMRAAIRELNLQRAAAGEPPLKVGIGVHTGVVAAGLLGGAQAEYTVIGDAVNVASRIESMTKEHAVDVLVSEFTWAKLSPAPAGHQIATQTIRGRKAPIVLYALDADAPDQSQGQSS